MRREFFLAVLIGLSTVAPALAHHSLAAYTRSSSLTVEGTVETYRWSNPHVRIAVKALTPDGDIKLYDVEGGSVGTLSTSGFTGTTVAVGDKVSISFYPRKDGVPGGFLISVTTADGRKFDTTRKARASGAKIGL